MLTETQLTKVTLRNVHDVTVSIPLINISEAEKIIPDKGYDVQYLQVSILAKGSVPHIPLKSNSNKTDNTLDKAIK